MKFTAIATPDRQGFDDWVAKVKASPEKLDTMQAYEQLAAPSEYHPVEFFSSVKPDLYQAVIEKFMGKGKSMDMTQKDGKDMDMSEHSHAGTEE